MSYYDFNPRRTPNGMATPPWVGAQIDAGLRAYMQRVYSYMAGGLAVPASSPTPPQPLAFTRRSLARR